MVKPPAPLSAYQKLHTTSLDVARTAVSSSLAPHRLTRTGDTFDLRHHVAPFGELSMHYIDYGGPVRVDIDSTQLHMVQVPTSGQSVIQHGNRTLTIQTGTAAITAPGAPMEMNYSAVNPRLMVHMQPALFASRLDLAREVGLTVDASSAIKLDLSRGRGRSWRLLLAVLVADLERHEGLSTAPFAIASMQAALVDSLLSAMAEEALEDRPSGPPRETVIQRAARLIEEHCTEPLTSHDIAEAMGMSVRSLQAGFREHLNTTPMSLLRQHRLRHVRDALVSGTAKSVTEAASRAGISHLGRLSSEYAHQFGETPSQTIRRS